MEELFVNVVRGPPRAHHEAVSSPQLMLLMMSQNSNSSELINIVLNRLKTADEQGSTELVGQLLNIALTSPLQPQQAEDLAEALLTLARDKMAWRDVSRWIAALIHYLCVGDLTVSIFSEFGAVEFATILLESHPSDPLCVAAAASLLSHFNCFPLGQAVGLLCKGLDDHCSHAFAAHQLVKCLAGLTSYYGGNSDWMQKVCTEFVCAKGVTSLTRAMEKLPEHEDTQVFCTRIIANVSGVDAGEFESAPLMRCVTRNLRTFGTTNTPLAAHALYALGNIPDEADVELVTRILEVSADPNIIYEAIRCLSSVATHVKDSKGAIATGGAVPLVLQAMGRHKNHTGILEEGCNMLSYMAYDSSSITQHVTSTGGIQLMLEAMKTFKTNPGLITAAAAALSGLSFNNSLGQQVMIDGRAVELLIQSMKASDRPRLHELCCLAFGTMCWNTDLKAQLVNNDGIDVILYSLGKHNESSGLVKNACRALAQIAFNNEEYRDIISKTDAAKLIIDAMRLHPTHDRAQMHGCVALSYLNWSMPNPSRYVHDSFKAIVEAMRNHTLSSDVQEHACRAFANLGGALPASESSEALHNIIEASKRHEKFADVQEEACRAMVTLSLQCPENKDLLARLGAAERVMAALRNFPKSYSVQQEACNALAHLAYEHAELNRIVTDLGGVGALLSAMRNHHSNSRVQLTACGGLSALAFDNAIAQRQIYDQNGVECVIAAMRTYPRLRIMELSCSVLGTLAWNTDIKESVAIIAIPEILNAMSTHHDSPLLQKATCRAISQFAFNSERNRKFLFESNAVPLIMRAVRTHMHADKLVSHALVALTYLCWENGTVAEAILSEGADDLLKQLSKAYEHNDKVFGKAAHLSKILVRKAQSPTSRSPLPGAESPDFGSPMPLRDDLPTPYQGVEDGPMSPLTVERDRSFYSAPQDKDDGRNRRLRGGYGDKSYTDDSYRRGRGGEGSRGGRGLRGRGRGAVHNESTNPDDLWDSPSTFHGSKSNNMNWQQQQLNEEQNILRGGANGYRGGANSYTRGGARGGNDRGRGGRNDYNDNSSRDNYAENRGRGGRGGRGRGASFTVRGN